jgi:hypothetical protein
MMQAADLRTRPGRIRHIRLALAVRFGYVSLDRFGELVAAEQERLTGAPVSAYKPSTVGRWEAGSEPSWDAALAIASLGGKNLDWLVKGDITPEELAAAEANARLAELVPDPDYFPEIKTGEDARRALGEPDPKRRRTNGER